LDVLMSQYEYKVVPAPNQGKKGKGVKTASGRFALALEEQMNALGVDGWEYVRADTLPCEERVGLTSKTTTYQNVLVFRRVVAPGDTRRVSDAEPVPPPAPVAVPLASSTGRVLRPPPSTPQQTHQAAPPAADATGAAAAAAAALRAYRTSSDDRTDVAAQ